MVVFVSGQGYPPVPHRDDEMQHVTSSRMYVHVQWWYVDGGCPIDGEDVQLGTQEVSRKMP
jgi:hypothetical protein